MKKLFIKLLIIFTICATSLFIASCENTPDTDEFTITYYVDGLKVNLNPSTYSKGDNIILPEPIHAKLYVFDGWYLSKDNKNNKITSTEGFNQDLVLYGYLTEFTDILPPTEEENELDKAFSYKSFSYDLEYEYDGFSYKESYVVNNSDFSVSYDTSKTSFVTKDNKQYCYYEDEYESYFLTEDDEEFVYMISSYYLLDLSKVDKSKLVKEDNHYKAKEDYIDEFGLLFTGYEETYLNATLYIEDSKLTKVLLESIDEYEYTTNYEITFTSFEEKEVTYDKNAVYYGDLYQSNDTDILEVFAKESGEEVSIKGKITGIYGNNFYITDNTGTILVYLGSNTEFNEFITLGTCVSLTGMVDIYKNIHQLKDVTSIGYVSDEFNETVVSLDNLSQATLEDNVTNIISINGYLKTLPSSFDASSKDITFEITDGTTNASVFMSKHLDYTTKQNFLSALENMNIGDKISIDNAFISYYNSYQIVITNGSSITSEEVEDTPQQGMPSSKYEPDTTPIIYARDYISSLLESEGYFITRGLPSIGDVEVLVIPVLFKGENIPSNYKENIETAFFGSSSDTGWESLSSYYYKSSYGALNIKGTVLDGYSTGNTVSYYENLYKEYLDDYEAYMNYESDYYPDPVEYLIIKDAIEYYDPYIDYSKYDSDNDGFIDSIYFVYMTEYSMEDDSFFWAYTDEYITDEVELYDDVEVDFYMFASYYFLEDEFYGSNINLNVETFIHETGHLLGLDDYYDYDPTSGSNALLGGGDMMDNNVGDHNAYSKALLGWLNPYVVRGCDSTITISSLESTSDAIFIYKDFNDSLFGEFIMIEFYTPDGLNIGASGNYGLFTNSGIRITHVDANLNTEDVYSIFEITKCNNSYTTNPLISLIEKDQNKSIVSTGYSENNDLFYVGDVLSNYKWHDGSSINFIVRVDSINDTNATITIDYKN